MWLRPGTVISLQTVLGDSGAWNNFTDWVTAVVPLGQRYTTPSLGSQETHRVERLRGWGALVCVCRDDTACEEYGRKPLMLEGTSCPATSPLEGCSSSAYET